MEWIYISTCCQVVANTINLSLTKEQPLHVMNTRTILNITWRLKSESMESECIDAYRFQYTDTMNSSKYSGSMFVLH